MDTHCFFTPKWSLLHSTNLYQCVLYSTAGEKFLFVLPMQNHLDKNTIYKKFD